MTRIQKAIALLLGSTLVCLLYVFLHATRVPIKELEADKRHIPHPIPAALKETLIKNYQEKQKELKKLEVKHMPLPLKRGPPKLKSRVAQKATTENPAEPQRGDDEKVAAAEEQVIELPSKDFDKAKEDTTDNSKVSLNDSDKNIFTNLKEDSQKVVETLPPARKAQSQSIAPIPQVIDKDKSQKVADIGNEKLSKGDGFKEYKLVDGKNEAEVDLDKRIKGVNIKPANSKDLAHYPDLIMQTDRQKDVVAAMKHAWKGYKTYAWGQDELKPQRKTGSEWFHLGLTIIDSLDTLWLMNMMEEYKDAREWVKHDFNLASPVPVNLFETTIRILGGLLSAFHLSKDDLYREKAVSDFLPFCYHFDKSFLSMMLCSNLG